MNTEDRRENLLNITDSGAEVLVRYREIEKRLSDELLRDIPQKKVACFFEVIGVPARKRTRIASLSLLATVCEHILFI